MTTDTIEAEPETARLTADVVLFGKDTGGVLHALVIRRGWAPFKGHWALPGGHVDAGEKPLPAAVRELFEETGVRVSPASLGLVGVYAEPGRDPRGRYATWLYTTVLSHLAIAAAGDDADAARWVPVDQLLSSGQDLAFDHQTLIRDALHFAL
jgi:8-oxo-dGTP diphosphatase